MTNIYEETAARLRDAYRSGTIAPLRDVLAPGDSEGAYQVQEINTRFWQAQGRRIVGRKIGLTAKAVQKQLGVDQPDFGVLFDDMALTSGARLAASRMIQPKAEAEIALILGADILDPEADAETVAKATASVAPAIEIVDSRITDWKISFADTVADNGSSAFFVLGEQRPLAGLDLYACGMVLEVNDEVVSIGAGAACLGHPLIAAAWLARTLAKAGDPLRAGDILMSGALGPMVAISAGDRVRAIIGGLGDCSFNLTGD